MMSPPKYRVSAVLSGLTVEHPLTSKSPAASAKTEMKYKGLFIVGYLFGRFEVDGISLFFG
jgi:hypothetical protein